jgi:hypothetical protein
MTTTPARAHRPAASSIYESGCYYASINGKLVRGEAGIVAHDTHGRAVRHAMAILQQYGVDGYQRKTATR